MATKFSDPTQQVVTVDEAAAISELWARRQKEAEGLYSGLSIQEVADTMGIPPSEVEILLRLVRNTPDAEVQVKQERTKKRRRRILITAAVCFWLTILAGAFAATYNLGQRNNRGYYYPDAYLSYSGEGYQLTMDNGSVRQSQDLKDYLPENLVVDFQGYTVDGASKNTSLKEVNLEYGLNEVIEKVLPRFSSYPSSYNNTDLQKALQSGVLGEYSNSIRFDEIVAKVNGKEIRAKLPVNIGGDRSLQSGINADVRRRLRIFANQAWRLSKGKDVSSPSSSPKPR